jgi:hypothetical protein
MKLLIITLFVLSLLYWTCKRLSISRWLNEFYGSREPSGLPSQSTDDQAKSRAEMDSLAEAGQESRDPYTNVSEEQDNETKETTQDTTVGCKGTGSHNEHVVLFHRQTH